MRPVLIYLIAMAGAHLVHYRNQRKQKHNELTLASPPPAIDKKDIVIKGSSLEFSDEEINKILLRRFSYYKELNLSLRQVFIQKLRKFVRHKIFIIKDEKGFREMPVLAGASAIQLCFGLKDFLLPFYKYIRIYPSEYFADTGIKILAGNVQGNMITIAWNHLLEGYANSTDGSNVGLHEMSHALYIQKLVIEKNYAAGFALKYNTLVEECTKAHYEESIGIKDLYSEYALQNLQEFWAESTELFFERPGCLKENYPDIFMAMKLLLNQNPLHPAMPLVRNHLSFEEKFKRIASRLTASILSGRLDPNL
jgi:MtfA peptidase